MSDQEAVAVLTVEPSPNEALYGLSLTNTEPRTRQVIRELCDPQSCPPQMDVVTAVQLASSVIELVRVCNEILQLIQEFRHGYEAIADLVHEVEFFAEFLRGLKRILEHRRTYHRIDPNTIKRALEHADATLLMLWTKLEPIQNTGSSAARRLKWMLRRASFQKLRIRIREHNVFLHTLSSVVHGETLLFIGDQQARLLELCNSTEYGIGKGVDLTMDITEGDKNGNETIQASFEPAGTPFLPDAMNPNALIRRDTFGPDLPPPYRSSCSFSCYCNCHSRGPNSSNMLIKANKIVLGIFSTSGRRCSVSSCCRTVTVSPRKLVYPRGRFQNAVTSLVMFCGFRIKHYLNTYRDVGETSDSIRYTKRGDLVRLKVCIESGSATPFDTGPDGWSLLHTAAYNGQLEIVKYLLDLRADTEVGEVGSRKPADFAILRAFAIDATKLQKEIMNAFPDIERYIFDFGFSPIHVAMLGRYDRGDTLRPCLQCLIDFVDEANNAPLGTDWKTFRRKEAEWSPLYTDLIEMFRAKAETPPRDKKPIIDCIDLADDKWGWPPFHWAAFTGRRKQMDILLQNNANVFIESPMKRNILHIAAESKRPDVLSYVLGIWAKHKDRLDINQHDRWGETPLHVAAYGSKACCKLLLGNGADPNSRQENNQTPLHYASQCKAAERIGVVELLCQAQGVQINAQDNDGRTPILELLDFSDCVEILASHEADLTIVDKAGNSVIHHTCIDEEPGMLKRLLELASDPLATIRRNIKGNTPLIEGLAHKSSRCVQHLLKSTRSGCDIEGEKGWRPVHYAAKWGNIGILKAILTHPEFQGGRLTADAKSSEWIAKDACMFEGEVKNLLRKYDTISASIKQEERNTPFEATSFHLPIGGFS